MLNRQTKQRCLFKVADYQQLQAVKSFHFLFSASLKVAWKLAVIAFGSFMRLDRFQRLRRNFILLGLVYFLLPGLDDSSSETTLNIRVPHAHGYINSSLYVCVYICMSLCVSVGWQ